MGGVEVWFNIAAPVSAIILLALSGKGKALNAYLAGYFLLSALGVLLLGKLSLLESMGSGYFFGYSVFSAMFVTIFCVNVALSDRLEHKKMSWVMAVVMYLIVAVNAGVYFESSPVLWGMYTSIMLSLECTLLCIGVLSSGILNGLFRLVNFRGSDSINLADSRRLHALRGWSAIRVDDRGEAQ